MLINLQSKWKTGLPSVVFCENPHVNRTGTQLGFLLLGVENYIIITKRMVSV